MTTAVTDPLAGRTLAKPAPVLFLVLDHRHARVLLDDGTALKSFPDARSPRMRGATFHNNRGSAPGRGEKHFHHVRREETKRHFERAAKELAARLKRHGGIGVILCGEHRTLAEFRRTLPAELNRAVLGTAAVSGKALPRQELRAAAEMARHFMP